MSAAGAATWRSVLYVPAHVEKYVAAAHTRGADCILLDLEDSVPLEQKPLARARAAEAAATLRRAGCEVAVRINAPLLLALPDLEAVVGPDVSALFVPKVRGPEHVRLLDETVSELELRRGMSRRTRFVPIVESCAAALLMAQIAAASERNVALVLGGEDLAAEAGFEPSEETLRGLKQQLVLAAAAAGIAPLGLLGTPGAFGDTESLRGMAQRSRRFGFVGATCIHPGQVTVLNEAFAPTVDEVANAQRVVLGSDEAARSGRGAFALDGRMVDAPIVARARRVLARHEALRR